MPILRPVIRDAFRQTLSGTPGSSSGVGAWWATPPISFGALGDSITRNMYTPSTAWAAQVGEVINYTGRCWAAWACQRLGRQAWADIDAFEGNSGFRTDQILSSLLPASNTRAIGVAGNTANIPYGVRARRPTYCFVQAGTNDLSQSVPMATAVANLQSIWSTLRASGIEPIAVSLLPRDAPAPFASSVPTWNTAIAAAAATDGVRFIDVYTNTTNGSFGFKPNWTFINGAADPTGLHPGNEACIQMAEDIATNLASWLPNRPRTPYVDTATTMVIANAALTQSRPLFSSLGGGIFPSTTGWGPRLETGGTSTVAVNAGGLAQIGNRLTITIPAPTGTDIYSDRNGPAAVTVTPGRRYALLARLNFTATHAEDIMAFGIQGPATAATLWTMGNINSRCAATAAGASLSARDIYHEWTQPPGLTSVRPWLQITSKNGGSGSVMEVAQLGIREIG